MRYAATLIVLLAAGVLSGCGGDDGPAASSPAKLAPSGTIFYAEAAVRPGGGRGEAAAAYLGRILDTDDVGGEVSKLLNDALEDADTDVFVSYTDDIEPWLGERVSAFISEAAPEPQGAIVLEATDTDAAGAALDKIVGPEVDDRTREGVDYRVEDDTATAIVDGAVVIGTEDGVEGAIDASKGQSLAEDADYEETLDGLAEDRLAHFYLDGRALFQAIPEDVGEADAGQLEMLRNLGETTGAVSLTVEEDAASFDLRASVESLRALGFLGPSTETNASPRLLELPADASVALAFPEFGDLVAAGLEQPARLGVTAPDVAAARKGFRDLTGEDLDETVSSFGDVGLFVSGTDRASIDFGAVLESSSSDTPLTAVRAVARLARRGGEVSVRDVPGGVSFSSPELPAPVTVTSEGEEGIVVSFRRSPAAVADPGRGALGESPRLGTARERLGGDYTATGFFDVPQLLSLAESFGAAEDPSYTAAKPYLDEIGPVVQGERRDGDDLIQRFTVGLK